MTITIGNWNRGGRAPRAQQTMRKMRDMVRRSLGTAAVWETARRIVADLPPRDEVSQAKAIRTWVGQRFHFVKDPPGDELLLSPEYMLAKIATDGKVLGDCDDAATLTAALGLAIGIPAQLLATDIYGTPLGFDHVFTVLRPFSGRSRSRVPVEMDITRPATMAMPRIARRLPLTV